MPLLYGIGESLYQYLNRIQPLTTSWTPSLASCWVGLLWSSIFKFCSSHRNKIFDINARNTASTPRHILTWFQPEHCTRHRLSTSCIGFITHSTEIDEGLFEVCGILHQKAFCGLYTTSAQGILSAISEKRVADELVNGALEPSLLQHSGRRFTPPESSI